MFVFRSITQQRTCVSLTCPNHYDSLITVILGEKK